MNIPNKILGIVILYHPPEDIKENILSYLGELDKLILWNNSQHEPIFHKENIIYEKILEMGNGTNVGIGTALNEAVNYAISEEYTHLLTMDQDSAFKERDFEKYINFIKKGSIDHSNCIYHPNYLVNNMLFNSQDVEFEYDDGFMTSGTMFPVSLFNKIGLFRADFFIDTIDTEYACRAKRNNINIVRVSSVVLLHVAGYQLRKRRFLWKVVLPNEYSPIRTYYMIRNALITFKEYPDLKTKREYLWYRFYKRMVFIVLYERSKFNKLKALLLGYYHGKKGILGKQKIFNE